jgi:hypothetical protein
MTTDTCAEPLPAEVLVDYSLGELGDGQEESVEEHLFSCERCSRALEAIVELGAGVATCVADGQVAVAVTDALVEQAIGRGAHVRQYRLSPGDTVACTAGPDDTFVAIRLAGPLQDLDDLALDVQLHDLTTGDRQARHMEDVTVDAVSQEVVLLVPGNIVRGYPRSRWTLHARARKGGDLIELGPYTLDHTPWDQRPSSG